MACGTGGGVGGADESRVEMGMIKRFTIGTLVLAVVLTGCATTGWNRESEDRAGIEGEPIPLNPTDPKYNNQYNDYFERIRRMIKEKWAYPCVKHWFRPCEYKDTQLVLDFGILKDGHVAYAIVQKPSEFAVYNEYDIKAVDAAAPFPPIPDLLLAERKGLPIRAVFQYVLIWPYG